MYDPLNPDWTTPRPTAADFPAATFAAARIDDPDRRLGWSNGTWSGDPQSVLSAKSACMAQIPVSMSYLGPKRPANDYEPTVAAAVIRYVLGPRLIWTGDYPYDTTLTDAVRHEAASIAADSNEQPGTPTEPFGWN